jgi:hypothetical protein
MIVNDRGVFFKGLEFVSKIENFFRFRIMYQTIFKFRFMYETFFKSMKPSLVQYGTFSFFSVRKICMLNFRLDLGETKKSLPEIQSWIMEKSSTNFL